MTLHDDAHWMRLALAQAQAAAQAGEVPVGAVVVRAGQCIASAHNAPIHRHDPTAHAEIIALRAAAQQLGNYRLEDCTLYVTLEPCAMCSGAMLHARLPRVVFGAADAKTGVAGSVLNLFAQAQLNHHTQVQGGVLADECTQLLQDFFRQRRQQQRMAALAAHPLREDALRTPDGRFAQLTDWPWPAQYCSHLPSLAGLRLHYVDAGPPEASTLWLCLHGPQRWGYSYRHLLPALVALGQRVVVPDLIGFGRSDKPKKERWHTPAQHAQVLSELLQALSSAQGGRWVLVTEGFAPVLAELSGRLSSLHPVGQLLLDELCSAEESPNPWQAPFPDRGFQAGPRAWAQWPVAATLPEQHRGLRLLHGQQQHRQAESARKLAAQAVEYFAA
ncbi:MAG: tRNA adenosine(34) deaminase TadA [Giesbergeria sp.]|uniref:tRNA adenosine(34) deaminase TadA n=1 Tax=Giesbergeria sp. TaxID=2818473 RepID=UPI002604606F|nr:tRNA adenosine(34) deaminase TadA [Giesbergeria sp.]MDD2609079.1 tRNA adenosine(34) deaminase TadA [Giesbergeria sp.]